MPAFSGINHVAFSVTDLDVSERFYTDVLGFLTVLDTGPARVCMDTGTGFTIALIKQPQGRSGGFDAANTGLDHLGLAADSREELVEWQQRFEELGVQHSPIQDMPLGHHLNFRDPDGIALELQAPSEMYAAALDRMRTQRLSKEEVLAAAEQMLGSEMVARGRG
ncbi:VOC family protein [Pedococcus aerophilus]|uniref:VOC family protein n=1 Tax=Pedococcus aerophilus TaxID=436356 RepID=A0ABN3UPK6_9MICO